MPLSTKIICPCLQEQQRKQVITKFHFVPVTISNVTHVPILVCLYVCSSCFLWSVPLTVVFSWLSDAVIIFTNLIDSIKLIPVKNKLFSLTKTDI